jgi:uncharacterized damage-inducible protein DinB
MADLLECVIQIKALGETIPRLDELLRRHPIPLWLERPAEDVWSAAEVAAHLADTELLFGVWLRLILTAEEPYLERLDENRLARRAAYRDWPPLLALSRLRTRRLENLELFESCSAEELSRAGRHPRRGNVTVSDLVALTLAHDTTHVGQIRDRLERAAKPGDDR